MALLTKYQQVALCAGLLMCQAALADGQTLGYQLPSMADGQGFYDKHRNEQIAAWSLRQIHASLPVIDDAWTNQLIAQMSAEMNASVRNTPLYTTVLVNDNNINAFAVPGGLIGMNTGTILSAQSMDELASVMAHEVAHISQRHYEHRQDNNKKLLALQLGGLLAAIAASASGSGDAALMAMAGSQASAAEVAASHSRENEREADRVGMQILAQVGYDTQAMPKFFGRMQRQLSLNQAKNAFVPSFVQSHPFTAERLSEANARSQTYPRASQTRLKQHAVIFDQLYWRVKYLSKQTTYAELIASSAYSEGAKLALAMYLADNGQFAKAETTWLEVSLDKQDPLMCLTGAFVFTASKQYERAKTLLAQCQLLYPERRDLRLALAEAELSLNQPNAALALLTPLVQDGSSDVVAWQLAYRAYDKRSQASGDTATKTIATIHALRSRSQLELWRGQYTGALQSLAQAEQLAKQLPQASSLLSMLDKDKQQVIVARDFKPR
ncbi:M48 family metalloprotease [Moraxella cuniculi]|uniref:Zn-dependent protease, contains TPR repeats n=1 Tax=Moraxella cuniculi TaxID=34061 RepID=A0A448GWE3_9GAMM|nr:M48 family metalloprotease [Moraxella cuniculi]VEG13123.1 Putative Zn-dependent protease, contains TPR repeats [Moraxella cuniculi]